MDSKEEMQQKENAGQPCKKSLKIAVIACITALIITCAVVATVVYITTRDSGEITKNVVTKNDDGTSESEKIVYRPRENIITLTTYSGVKLFLDYNKRMALTAIASGPRPMCVVFPLDSLPSDPEDMKRAMKSSAEISNEQTDQQNQTQQEWFVSSEPVSDDSFLSSGARDACNGLQIYWATLGNRGRGFTTGMMREKRDVHVCRLTLTSRTLYRNNLTGQYYWITGTYYYYYYCDANKNPIAG